MLVFRPVAADEMAEQEGTGFPFLQPLARGMLQPRRKRESLCQQALPCASSPGGETEQAPAVLLPFLRNWGRRFAEEPRNPAEAEAEAEEDQDQRDWG